MGSGGGSDRAQRAAEEAEAQRQAMIAQGTSRVNTLFDSPQREKQYADYLAAVRERYGEQLGDQKEIADRRSKFALARGGLSGGSADVDARRRLGKEYTEGVLKAEGFAQSGVGQLRGQDEGARLQLLQLIQQGMDATTAASRAGAAIQQSAQQAKAGVLPDALGDVFGNTASIYRTQEEAAERRRGAQDAQGAIYSRPFSG